jgi:hypothetical protein
VGYTGWIKRGIPVEFGGVKAYKKGVTIKNLRKTLLNTHAHTHTYSKDRHVYKNILEK